MKRPSHWNGFTLLELILTIVIFAVVGIMAVSFFNKGVTRTDIAVSQLSADAKLQLVLENMIQVAGHSVNGIMDVNEHVGDVNSTNTYYGDGNSYFVANKMYVCPNTDTKTFEPSEKKQFLLVTIKPSSASGVSLSYIFGANDVNTANACE